MNRVMLIAESILSCSNSWVAKYEVKMVIDCKPLRICHISIVLFYGKYTVKDWKDPQKVLALKFIYTTNNR